jgi:hypothetical protein
LRRKIALHGFGSTPIVFKYLIELAAKDGAPIDWCMILPTPEHRALVRSILPSSDILDVYQALPSPSVGGDLSLLAEYPGSLAEDLGADKRPWGAQDGRKRFARGMDYHLLYKKFLTDRGATHFLAGGVIEGAEGKIAVATARQLGLSIMVPIDCRSLTGTFFAADALAGLPAHAAPREDLLPKAAEFIERFRKSAMPAHCPPNDFVPIDGDDELVYNDLPSTPARFVGLLRKAAERPDLFKPDQIRASVLNNLPVLRDKWWGLRTSRAAREFDVGDLAALPKRFIFYPMQVTPEASINTPAPYYVDQMRAIDTLRLAMPPDCALVVKEHPAGIGFRSLDFVRRLRKLPGLLVAKYTMDSRDISLRASLTCAVTGTAVLEAFFLGRPGFALGPGLSHWAMGCGGATRSLRDEIAVRIDTPIPDQMVVERVATLLSVRYPFLFLSPFYPGEPVLRRGNMRRMYEALLDHLTRLDAHAARSVKRRKTAS